MHKVLGHTVLRVSPIRGVIPAIVSSSTALAVWLPAVLVVLVSYTWRLPLLMTRGFDVDEFEHLHVAWLISNGWLPYRDFFEHHTPLFHFALAPFFGSFAVGTNTEEAIAFLFFARRLAWLLAGVILFLVCWLGTVWRDVRAGCVGMLLLSNTAVFLTTTIEIRPDVLATVLWLSCLTCALYAVDADASASSRAWRFALSGVLLGAAVLTTQKMLFGAAGFGAGLTWYVLDARGWPARAHRAAGVAVAAIGCIVAIGVMLFYFHVRDGLGSFVEYNIILNSRWKEQFSPYNNLRQLAYQNPYLVICGLAGLVRISQRLLQGRGGPADAALLASTSAFIAGVFVIPVAQHQYFLLFLPLLALCAGGFLIEGFDRLKALRECGGRREWVRALGATAALVAAALLFIVWGMPSPWGAGIIGAYWFMSLVFAMALVSVGRPAAAVALFLVALSAPHLKQFQDSFEMRNTSQLAEIRYVMDHTAPTDTVMDGFSGPGVFRPHAYFYFMPHQGVRLMISDQEWENLHRDLRSGRIAPKLVIFDDYLRQLPEPITSLLTERYVPAGIGDIWRRREQ